MQIDHRLYNAGVLHEDPDGEQEAHPKAEGTNDAANLPLSIMPFHEQAAIPERLQRALTLLLKANEYAELADGNSWEFAVEIKYLRELELVENDLRLLVRLEYVAHALDVTESESVGRQFQQAGELYFTDRTCFILKAKGVAAAKQYDRSDNRPHSRPALEVPLWDAANRVLRFRGKTIKRFKYRAANQETILSAFQEEGWPGRIDDPLAPSESTDAKRRLSDTIKCLNRKQECKLIHFFGDGSGEGVIWEPVTASDSDSSEVGTIPFVSIVEARYDDWDQHLG